MTLARVQLNREFGFRPLIAAGHQLFFDDKLGAILQIPFCHPLGGIHSLDLHRLHLEDAVLFDVHDSHRIEHPFAAAVPFADMLFHIPHPGVFPHIEGVDPVVLGEMLAVVVDAAARHDVHIGPFADIEFVVDEILQAAFVYHDGDMDGFPFRAGTDIDLDPPAVFLRPDFDVGRALPPRAPAVHTDVESALRPAGHARNGFQKLPDD